MKFGKIFFFLLIVIIFYSCEKETVQPDPDKVYDPTPYNLVQPEGFPEIIIPADNPMTEEGIALGRRLFYDSILSGDNTQSCASCHAQAFAFSDNAKPFSEGIDGLSGSRNAMPVINVAWMDFLFWDGRAGSVEEQALGPVPNPVEMHLNWADAMEKLNNSDVYPELFFDAFGTSEIDSMLTVKAIAQFERTIISSNSKWDRYLRGEVSLSQAESAGFEIFFTEKGDCFHCHSTILFTDNTFHNNGLDSVFSDLGLQVITGNTKDAGKFKTPTLRNIEYTAPYMHDSRFETLEEVIDFYSEGLHWSPTIDPLMKKLDQGGAQLTEDEKQNLLAYLMTLSDESFLSNPDFFDPFKRE